MLFGEACTRCRKRVWWCFGEGAGRIPRGERPVPAAHLQSLPAVPHHCPRLPLAGTEGDAGGRAPFPAPRLRLPGRRSLGTPAGAGALPREPRRFGSHREPQGAPQEPAASALQEDALGPAPRRPTPALPRSPALARPGYRQPAPPGSPALTAARLWARPPRDNRAPGGRGRGGGGTAERAERTPGSRRRTGALAPAPPHGRPTPHTHTHSRAARAGPAPRRTRAREPEESLE